MTGTPRTTRRAAALIAVALVAAGLGFLADGAHLLRRLEQATIDARFQVRGAEPARSEGVVVVGVDDSTFNYLRDHHLHSRWPYPRRYDARVIDQLRRAGASVIAVDVQFTEQSDRRDDNALIEAVGRADGVVLSTTELEPGGHTAVLGSDALVRSLGARVGHAKVSSDSDGAVRAMQYSVASLRTFAVAVAEAETGRPVPVALFGGPHRRVPIDYAGPPGTFASLPYWRVLRGRFPHHLVAGKVVIVGAVAPTFQDLHQTPTGAAPMAGPEVLANQVTTVLAGIPLRPPADAVTLLTILLLALVVPLAAIRLGTPAVMLVGLAVLLAWTLATQLAFDAGTQLDYADPVAALVLATAGAVLVGLWDERREIHRLRNLFAADAGGVVAEVLGPDHGRLAATAIIAGYRIEEQIGRGGMGVVYRADQLALERSVAIKLIASERARDPVFRARFEAESKLAASIEHPNVIPVYEAGEDDGLLFIAMRLVAGTDLARLLVDEGALAPARTARLVAQLGGALDAAHAHGLVHRDVKPANVLLTRANPEHLYLTDFGVAKSVAGDRGLTIGDGWLGTLDYLAPEQIRGEPASAAVDVYALACLVHHCLTASVPFPRDEDAAKLWAQVNAPPPAPTELVPSLPAAIDEVIRRGMAKDPACRYRSAGELATACAEALGVVVTVDAAEPEGEQRRRRPSVAGGRADPTVASE
jgi:CHASE2 domain-containing sensor protein